jgi:hypothetical protein
MAYQEFYVDAGAGSASDNNGGWPAGTDGAPVVSRGNVDGTDAGGGYYDLEDMDSGGWGSAAIGDYVQFDPGGTPAHGRITALAVGLDSDVIRVYKTGGGSFVAAGKSAYVGGSWSTIGKAAALITTASTDMAGVPDHPPRVNIRSSATYTENVTLANDGTDDVQITFEGFTTSAGDGGVASISGQVLNNADRIVIRNLSCTNAADHAFEIGSGSYYCVYENCTGATNTASSSGFYSTGRDSVFRNCTVTTATANGFVCAGLRNRYIGCAALDCGGYGYLASTTAIFVRCLAAGCGDDGFTMTSTDGMVIGCIAYGSTGGSGFKFTNGSSYLRCLANSIAYGNNQYGIELTTGGSIYEDYNALGSNSAGEYDANMNAAFRGAHTLDLAADPFVDAAGGDFRINPLSAAGRTLLAAAAPGGLAGVDAAGIDIGALQMVRRAAAPFVAAAFH